MCISKYRSVNVYIILLARIQHELVVLYSYKVPEFTTCSQNLQQHFLECETSASNVGSCRQLPSTVLLALPLFGEILEYFRFAIHVMRSNYPRRIPEKDSPICIHTPNNINIIPYLPASSQFFPFPINIYWSTTYQSYAIGYEPNYFVEFPQSIAIISASSSYNFILSICVKIQIFNYLNVHAYTHTHTLVHLSQTIRDCKYLSDLKGFEWRIEEQLTKQQMNNSNCQLAFVEQGFANTIDIY